MNDLYFIWSIEHNSWWGPCSCGYTTNREKAGKYTLEEATAICKDANHTRTNYRDLHPNEAIVPCY